MKMSDMKNSSAVDVDNKVEELKKELFDLRIQKTTSGIEKPHEKYTAKKTIARLLTHKNALKKGN